jgi:hypothetical protein
VAFARIVERILVERVGIVRVAARGVECRRVEEQIVKFSRRRRPLLAERLGDVESRWRDRIGAGRFGGDATVIAPP